MPNLSGEGRRRGTLRDALDEALAAAPAPSLVAEELGADTCPECGGRGWVLRADAGAGTARRCACSAKAVVPRLEQEAGVPSRYARCTLANFQVTGAHREGLLAARSLTQRWVEEFLGEAGSFRESGLLFIGPPGVGKTHLAAAALGELIRRYRVRGRFIDFTSLLYQIQSTFDAGTDSRKSMVFAMRTFRSANVCSVSSCFGMSTPARRATAPFALSHAICTWRVNGNMSGKKRYVVSAEGSIFFAVQCASAFSRMAERFRRMLTKRGVEA